VGPQATNMVDTTEVNSHFLFIISPVFIIRVIYHMQGAVYCRQIEWSPLITNLYPEQAPQ
jgi:hypothetical protein